MSSPTSMREGQLSEGQMKAITLEEMEYINRDLQEKYELLLRASTMQQLERAAFDEFDDFYDHAPCGFHIIDDTGMILKMNKTELNWLGYTKEEIENKTHEIELHSYNSSIQFYKYMPVLRDMGKVEQVEVEFIRRDGTLLHALVSASGIYDDEGSFAFGKITLWDISERKKTEEEMLKVNRHLRSIKERFEEKNAMLQKLNEELQQMKKEKKEFLETIGAGLEQPIDKAQSLCQALLATHPDNADQIRQIEAAINKAGRFVGKYHAKHRLASDKGSLQFSSFNLSGLIVTSANRLDEQAGKKKVLVNCEIFEELWIESDKELLSQLIDSLLSTVISLSLPGSDIPARLIHKVNACVIELEIKGLSISRREFIQMFDKATPHDMQESMIVDAHLINALVDSLGYNLSINPTNHHGTLLRLSLPL